MRAYGSAKEGQAWPVTEDSSEAYVRVVRIKNANGEEKTLRFPMQLDLERPKRARTTFSEEQLRLLDDAFRACGYLTGERRARLAETLGLTDTQVKVWFQNRRTKDRKRKDSEDIPALSQSSTIKTSSTPSLLSPSLPSFPPLFGSTSSSLPPSVLLYPLFPPFFSAQSTLPPSLHLTPHHTFSFSPSLPEPPNFATVVPICK